MKFETGQLVSLRYASGKEGGLGIIKKINVSGMPKEYTTYAVYSLKLDKTVLVTQSLLSPVHPQGDESDV